MAVFSSASLTHGVIIIIITVRGGKGRRSFTAALPRSGFPAWLVIVGPVVYDNNYYIGWSASSLICRFSVQEDYAHKLVAWLLNNQRALSFCEYSKQTK